MRNGLRNRSEFENRQVQYAFGPSAVLGKKMDLVNFGLKERLNATRDEKILS